MLWPRPGRIFAASRSHTFAQLATAIDDAFARWDRSHLHEFTRVDGSRLGIPSAEDYEPEHLRDYKRAKLGQLALGEQFAYVFDFGDQWEHLCTVGPMRIDPLQTLGIESDGPLPYFGWAISPTNTSDAGTVTTARVPSHADHATRTYRRCAGVGARTSCVGRGALPVLGRRSVKGRLTKTISLSKVRIDDNQTSTLVG